MRSPCKNLIKTILIISFCNGCAAIPSNKVKLDYYPEVVKENMASLNLRYSYDETHAGLTQDAYSDYYKYIKKNNSDRTYEDYLFFNYFDNKENELINKSDKVSEIFNYNIIFNLKSKNSSIDKLNEKDYSGCVVKISSKKDLGFCPITNLIAPLTLAILPYYCQHTYQAQATLISYPSKEELKDKAINIFPNQINFSSDKIQIKQTKTKNNGIVKTNNYLLTKDKKRINEGDYFLDENNQIAKLLKTYELKDKVHEVWSSLMLLAAIPITPLRKLPTPDAAKSQVENTISEALTRSILNDASSFEECKKSSSSLNKKK
jgi:hypothetical protein